MEAVLILFDVSFYIGALLSLVIQVLLELEEEL